MRNRFLSPLRLRHDPLSGPALKRFSGMRKPSGRPIIRPNMITHEEISKKAREIWEREGRPEGRDIEHWLQAETELRQESPQHQSSNGTNATGDTMLHVPGDLKENGARKRTARRVK